MCILGPSHKHFLFACRGLRRGLKAIGSGTGLLSGSEPSGSSRDSASPSVTPNGVTASAPDRAHLAAAASCRSFTLKQLPVSPFSAQHHAQPLKNGVTEPQRLQNRAELPNRSTQLAFATPCAGTKASAALLECPLTTRTQTKWFWVRYAGAASSCWSQHWEVLQEKRTTRHLEHNYSFLGLFFVFFPSVQTDTLTQSARMILSSCTHWAN